MKRVNKKKSFIKCKMHGLKVASALLLGLVGGGSWMFTIYQTPKVFAEYKPKTLVFENPNSPKFTETKLIAVEEPKDCYTAADKWAEVYNVDASLLHKIIKAESGNKHRVENNHSTATGCFQFVLGTWRSFGKKLWGDDFYGKNIYNFSDNAELATWMISEDGLSHWDASKHNWSK